MTSNSVFSSAAAARPRAAPRGRHGHRRGGGHAPLLFEQLRELGRLHHGEARELVHDCVQIGHVAVNLPSTGGAHGPLPLPPVNRTRRRERRPRIPRASRAAPRRSARELRARRREQPRRAAAPAPGSRPDELAAQLVEARQRRERRDLGARRAAAPSSTPPLSCELLVLLGEVDERSWRAPTGSPNDERDRGRAREAAPRAPRSRVPSAARAQQRVLRAPGTRTAVAACAQRRAQLVDLARRRGRGSRRRYTLVARAELVAAARRPASSFCARVSMVAPYAAAVRSTERRIDADARAPSWSRSRSS